jgi:hypothetical protein
VQELLKSFNFVMMKMEAARSYGVIAQNTVDNKHLVARKKNEEFVTISSAIQIDRFSYPELLHLTRTLNVGVYGTVFVPSPPTLWQPERNLILNVRFFCYSGQKI